MRLFQETVQLVRQKIQTAQSAFLLPVGFTGEEMLPFIKERLIAQAILTKTPLNADLAVLVADYSVGSF